MEKNNDKIKRDAAILIKQRIMNEIEPYFVGCLIKPFSHSSAQSAIGTAICQFRKLYRS